MAIKIDDKAYRCQFCGKLFNKDNTDGSYSPKQTVDIHETTHDPIYFPMTPQELRSIILFIYTKDEKLISEFLYERLKSFNNHGK